MSIYEGFEIHLSLVHIRKTDYLFARTKPTPSKSDRPTFNFRDQNQHHRRLQGDQQASKAINRLPRRSTGGYPRLIDCALISAMDGASK
ncbi:uncharacterized protein PGTG_01998 [Puccinia graminis f. sp. tritici CRL 75-36-700-3]|uniref:Uncharacterized protein n=1 Tax=Puccinia graminis f. sp. tritici (strain CRL 75-36-700-3 / race SCCL) TaxID=418459 RepID=E3JTN0_PUCGT|nr:uncharacterized protein PGTG_01998 [Puccinia graminis f. sp. tritici CRL 75-36-700-3]EFP75405.2 hypothetical protein PGTG_01998 [Puccinia graminis f. sp. tritici CRL 75-36-700-3]